MVEVEAYRYHERISDDGVEEEADHEERAHFVVICTGIRW